MRSSRSVGTSLFYYSGGFMTQSPDITKLSQAMLIVQQQLQPAIKDAKNPFIGNEYATLNSVMESCRNLLSAQGIWLTQLPCPAPVELGAGHIGLETHLIHAESGQWISSTAPSSRYRKTIHREWAVPSPMPRGILCAPSSVS